MTKKQKILTTVFIVIGAAAIIFFGMRVMRSFMRMRGAGPFGKPPAANQTDINLIRDWMTLPYIAEMYDVPPEVLFKSLELGKDGKKNFLEKEYDKMSLKKLNDELYPDQDGIILAHVRAAIQAMQQQERPPQFPATPLPVTSTPTP